ncbi:MAG: hypothetical protein V4595_08435 [Pseudomonadota bacterium]|jgi:hypothetical protein
MTTGDAEQIGYSHSMRGIATLVALCLSTSATADVVTGPSQGYIESVEFGEASFLTTYRTPNGIPYQRGLGRDAGITRHAVSWAPNALPVYVETGRDARGGYLLMSTLLADADGRSACWTVMAVTERGAALRARLDRELARWAGGCLSVHTVGIERVIARWKAAQRDINGGLTRLSAVGRTRYLVDMADSEGRILGLPSFLPQQIDQSVLDAIADRCELPRTNLYKREQGGISFRPRVTGAQESSADARANGCVTRAIAYLPGAQ